MLADHLQKNKQIIQKFKETGDSQNIEDCFQHDMGYGDCKDLTRKTASDKILRDKVFSIAKNPKYDGYQRGLASMVYTFFNKKNSCYACTIRRLIYPR